MRGCLCWWVGSRLLPLSHLFLQEGENGESTISLNQNKQTQTELTSFNMNFTQQITLQATITVNLSVPELQSKKQLNQWLMSDAARIHLIDHLKPSSFNEVKAIKAAKEVNTISQM